MKKRRILIIAGEASGDLQAAYLVKSLKSINPNIEIFGIGGNQMKTQGVEVIYDIV
ncbi:MAG: lipid-A-disaccharide synthase, partial [Candidatus Omnitrophica bacterium]|nr:lipid-A-disaccharide synthase [Candidatus Omnitrophota bacterium]